MPPMAHDAGALFSPGHASLARKVIPVKRFSVEFSGWPAWEPIQNVALSDKGMLSTWPVGWLWKVVLEIEVGTDADQENSLPILCDAEISGVKHRPLNPVARGPVAAELIFQQRPALTECHSIDVLNDECFRFHSSEDPIELPIQKVNGVVPTSFPALAVALTGIAAHK
jgi:hypothetical protein